MKDFFQRPMVKVFTLFVFSLAVFAAVSVFRDAKPVQAAVKEIYNSQDKLTKTVKLDLNGDGKTEKILIRAVRSGDEYDWLDRVVLKINGRTVFEESRNKENYIYSIDVSKVTLAGDEILLWINDHIENDDCLTDSLYRYDAKTAKLKRLLVLDSQNWKKGGFHINTTGTTSGNVVNVKYMGQVMASGYMTWTFKYKYSNNRFTLVSDTAAISRMSHSKTFKATKKIKFYKKAGSKKTAFTLNKGGKAALKKIRLYKGAYYLQFKKGKKTGWIYGDQQEIFKDVILAG